MKARQTLFHIWLVLTGIYWISGLLYDVDGIVLKFQTGSQSRWLVLGLAIMMAILVPMAVLVAGRTALWIADSLGSRGDPGGSQGAISEELGCVEGVGEAGGNGVRRLEQRGAVAFAVVIFPQMWRRLNQPFAACGAGFFPAVEHPQPALAAIAGQPQSRANCSISGCIGNSAGSSPPCSQMFRHRRGR